MIKLYDKDDNSTYLKPQAIVRFDKKGELIASNASLDSCVILRDLNFKYLDKFCSNWRPIKDIQFHPQHNWLAIGAWGHESIVIFDIDKRRIIHKVLDENKRGVNSIAFSEDGHWLAAGYRNHGRVGLWQVVDHPPYLKQLEPIYSHKGTEVRRVAFSPDSTLLATGGKDDLVRLWEVPSRISFGQPLRGHTQWISGIVFAQDGTSLISAAGDNTLRHWDIQTQEALAPPWRGHQSEIRNLAISPVTGSTLVSVARDKNTIVWTQSPRQSVNGPLRRVPRHITWDSVVWLGPLDEGSDRKDFATSLSFNHDATRFAAALANTIRIWDPINPTHKPIDLKGHKAPVWSLAFQPKGELLASGSADGAIHLWEVSAQQVAFCFYYGPTPTVGCQQEQKAGSRNLVRSLSFSPDGMVLASASRTGSVVLWDVKNQRLIHRIPTSAIALEFHPNGRYLAITSGDSNVRIYNPADGSLVRTLSQHTVWIRSLAFSLDGQHLVTASDDQTMIVWDLKSGDVLHTLLGHSNWIHGMRYTGTTTDPILVSVDHNGVMIFWDGKSYEQITSPIRSHNNLVRGIAVNSQKRLLETGDGNGNIMLCKVDISRLTELACEIANRSLTPQEWEGLFGKKLCIQKLMVKK